MTLHLALDPGDTTPPYEQIRRSIAGRIDAGVLQVGDKLPPVRTLADRLGVAPGTVARAYKELEQVGLIETAGRAGTRVAPVREQRDGQLRALATTYVQRARELGCLDRDLREALERALER